MKTTLSIISLIFITSTIVLFKQNEANKKYIKTTLRTYISTTKEKTARQQERFKNGWKYGVYSSNTALRHTKDLTNRDKAIYWHWMQKEADKLGIELK